MRTLILLLLPLLSLGQAKGILLEDLTWMQAEKILTPETIVVIPLGAASKEHGPHLLLKNDLILAEYFKNRVLQSANVVIAPTINYHFYPSFVEYPGSTSLKLGTARDMVIDICTGLSKFGPKKFYVLNTGVSTVRALQPAADSLQKAGITMHFTDLIKSLEPIESKIRQQEGGTHADEMETSMILYMKPDAVDMKKAVKDYHPSTGRGLTRDPNNKNSTYSASGVWGDATLATKEKGKIIVEGLVEVILKDIEKIRATTVKQ
ncbi:MAG TPA: creatininase family protein [Cyclobacteriaceae bacterium]|nr:creatininase family protein [Cyclobacteriaceae bacterium]